jgi:transcription elongation factor GreB
LKENVLMSRGFVKEDDLELAGTELQERPISEHPNYVTTEGMVALKEKESSLLLMREKLSKDADNPVIAQEIAMIERDLRYFQARIESAMVVETKPNVESVVFGTTVTATDLDGNSYEFKIVGEDEADATHFKVSYVSPLAQALLGKKIGETAKWLRPAGNLELEIIRITA